MPSLGEFDGVRSFDCVADGFPGFPGHLAIAQPETFTASAECRGGVVSRRAGESRQPRTPTTSKEWSGFPERSRRTPSSRGNVKPTKRNATLARERNAGSGHSECQPRHRRRRARLAPTDRFATGGSPHGTCSATWWELERFMGPHPTAGHCSCVQWLAPSAHAASRVQRGSWNTA